MNKKNQQRFPKSELNRMEKNEHVLDSQTLFSNPIERAQSQHRTILHAIEPMPSSVTRFTALYALGSTPSV